MKIICFISVLLSISSGLYAQPFGEAAQGYRIISLDYENSSGEDGSTYFKYDKNGNLWKSYWSLNDKHRSSDNLYLHDSRGNLISAYREYSDGVKSIELFSYDSSEHKISEYFYRSDNITGSATYYYEGMLVRRAELKGYKGWLNGTLIFYYDDHNFKERATLKKNGDDICNILYEYDSNNNLVKEYWDFQGKWEQTFYYNYEKIVAKRYFYSSPFLSGKGKLRIIEENYTFNDEVYGPSLYFYNDMDLLIKKVFNRSDNFSTITLYEYDDDRRLISSQRSARDGSETKYLYNYDENDNLVLRTAYREDTLYGFESYVYDSYGVQTKAFVKNLDNWMTGTLSFKSDALGTLTSGSFSGQDGVNAVITFTYDTEGQLREIKWEFDSGKFQQYYFKYEP